MLPVADLEAPLTDMVDWLFTDPQLTKTITYRLYTGQDDEGEDSFTDISMLAIPHQVKLWNVPIDVAMKVQGVARAFIVLEKNFPEGTILDDLTTSDRVRYGAAEYQIIGFDKSQGWVINVICQGE